MQKSLVGAGPSPSWWSCWALTSGFSLVLLRRRRLLSTRATSALPSAAAPATLGPAASTASVCSWQTRRCERRPRMPLQTLEHVWQTWSAKGSVGAASSTADLLLWRWCVLRARSLQKIFKRLEQGISKSIYPSGACSLSTTAGLTLSGASASAAHATSPAAPAPKGQLVASGCPWQVRRCEARPRVPLHILQHAWQILSAIGSIGAAGVCGAADLDSTTGLAGPGLLSRGFLQWRLCDLRLNSVMYPLEQTRQVNFESISSSVDRSL